MESTFKFGSFRLVKFLTDFFNSCIIHNYFPPKMLERVIRPIVKNKNDDMFECKHFRPVMISSNFFKLLEYCLLPSLEKFCDVSSLQFGYRKNYGCYYSK